MRVELRREGGAIEGGANEGGPGDGDGFEGSDEEEKEWRRNRCCLEVAGCLGKEEELWSLREEERESCSVVVVVGSSVERGILAPSLLLLHGFIAGGQLVGWM